jgi:hypothetical protein
VFLLAAKLHGRELRLEREARGIREVSFGRGAQNDPFVVALWRRERYFFWPIAAVSAVVLALFASLPWPLTYVFVPGIIGFTVGGTASFVRRRRRA